MMQSGANPNAQEAAELQVIPAVKQPLKKRIANAANLVNRVAFTPLNDVTGTVATVYGYTEVYALLVTGPNRLYFNILYFTPTLGPILLHALPFRPETKKHRLKVFQHIMHATLNSAFLSSSAQQILLLLAGGADRGALLGGITAIQVGTTALAIPCSYYDLKMRDGQRYSKVAEGFLRYVMRPLQTAASLGFFLDIFNEHLHLSPRWMPTAVGGGLGLARLGFEIANQRRNHKDGAAERLVEELIHEGLFNNLSTSSVIFTVIASLYAARHAGVIPDDVFYGVMSVAITVFALSTAGSVITFVADEKPRHENDERQALLHTDDEQPEPSHDAENRVEVLDDDVVAEAAPAPAIANAIAPAAPAPSSPKSAQKFGLFASSNLESSIKILAQHASMEIVSETTIITSANKH